MLTSLIVHSWYTLASYVLSPGRVTIIEPAPNLDPTDPIDILQIVRDFVLDGRLARKMFPRRSLPPSRHLGQDFSLTLHGPEGEFKYELLIEHHPRRDDACRGELETLLHNDQCVAAYNRGRAIPGPDGDWGDEPPEDGQPAHVDPWLSIIGQLDASLDPRIDAFRRQLARIHVVHSQPDIGDSDDEHALERRARDDLAAAVPLLRDPELTLAVVLPDCLLDAELEPFLAEAHAAQLAGRGAQLLLSSPRRALLRRFGDLAQRPGSSA